MSSEIGYCYIWECGRVWVTCPEIWGRRALNSFATVLVVMMSTVGRGGKDRFRGIRARGRNGGYIEPGLEISIFWSFFSFYFMLLHREAVWYGMIVNTGDKPKPAFGRSSGSGPGEGYPVRRRSWPSTQIRDTTLGPG